MFTPTPHPITMTEATIRAHIGHLSRAIDRANDRGDWIEAEEMQDALDLYHQELAERGARGLDALARDADLYGEVVYAEIAERR